MLQIAPTRNRDREVSPTGVSRPHHPCSSGAPAPDPFGSGHSRTTAVGLPSRRARACPSPCVLLSDRLTPVGQDRLILTRSGAGAPELQRWARCLPGRRDIPVPIDTATNASRPEVSPTGRVESGRRDIPVPIGTSTNASRPEVSPTGVMNHTRMTTGSTRGLRCICFAKKRRSAPRISAWTVSVSSFCSSLRFSMTLRVICFASAINSSDLSM